MSDSDYLVVVKPSARKVCATAGRWVNRRGPRRAFDSKALACAWARRCREPATRVWVQDAPSWADDEADGYLVGHSGSVARTAPPAQQRTLSDTDR